LKRLRVPMTRRETVPERLAGATTVVFEAVQGERG
jgi:hypothetical protein